MVCEKCWEEAALLSASSNRSQYECYLEILEKHHEFGYRIDPHKEVMPDA
jgi:hypothetical protein